LHFRHSVLQSDAQDRVQVHGARHLPWPEITLNLKAAKALGLDIPAMVYARADEIIE
jgi:hypothetical protein